MKNPLRKRLLRELREDMGRYLVIFLFMVMLISLVSGFLVADDSIRAAYDDSFEKYNIEHGHLAFDHKADTDLITRIEDKGHVTLYDLKYADMACDEYDSTIRVYETRDHVNKECVYDGTLPAKAGEIAIDRVYAQNNGIVTGDTLTIKGKTLTVTGLIALPDYSGLFAKNSDMMFDAVHFSVAVMSADGFAALAGGKYVCNYAWQYNDGIPDDDAEEKELSDEFLSDLGEVLEDYDTEIVQDQIDALTAQAEPYEKIMKEELILALLGDEKAISKYNNARKHVEAIADTEIDESNIVKIDDYLPRYGNKAINFAGSDLGQDRGMFLLLDYIITVVLAFIFAITISGTISKEAGVIGTLRASGYTRGELIRHYMTLPIAVTLVAAIIGNILGYTVLKDHMAKLYYDSYSLVSYETLMSKEAFINTTVIPLIIMLVVNYVMLATKLQLSPLKFLRHELSGRKSKLSIPLSPRISFMNRFRLRIILKNLPAYGVLMAGIILAGTIAVFGTMFGPLLEDYSKIVADSNIATYQYVLEEQVDTANLQAEKYCVTSLETTDDRFMTDDVSIFGIQPNSSYISANIDKDTVLISNGFAAKYGYQAGDTITLKDPYEDKTYEFTVAGEYTYDGAISIFMDRSSFNKMFKMSTDYFSGYFSNEELTDIDDDDIETIITQQDLLKIATQLKVSMGGFFGMVKYFAMIMFILMMYILTKHIIEKDQISISMAKILGYSGREIGGLYLVSTSVVVIISLLAAIPIVGALLKWAFTSYIYTMMTGYIPYAIDSSCYVKMFTLGIISYMIVCLVLMIRINRIPKSDALKNVE